MSCRVCDSTHLEPVLDLGEQPWSNHFLKKEEVGTEPFYPLRVVYCHACSMSQLDFTIKKEIMFSDHTYLSSVTKTLSEHFADVAAEVDNRFFKDREQKSILDIGSNDGTQLKHFQKLRYDVLGVESSKRIAKIANDAGVPTLNSFFNIETMRSIGRNFDAFNAAGVFFHLEELHSVCQAIKEGLRGDGVFVVQFLYMKRIMETLAFDQIYHEHLLYYTLQTIEILLNRHGLAMFDARLAHIHGGSVIGFVGHRGVRPVSPRLAQMRAEEQASGCNAASAYREFAVRIERLKEENLAYLDAARLAGKRVFGMGAPVKGNTLLNHFGVGTERIQCLVEKNPLRRGLYSPGMHIPIVMEDELEQVPDIYYVLAWNFKDEILRNHRDLSKKGVAFYFPIDPTVSA